MADEVGRDVAVTWGGVAVEGLREKGLSCNGEPIDTTNDDDDGIRKLLNRTKRDEVNISLSGVTKNHLMKADFFAGNRQKTVIMTWANGATLTGTFNMVNWNETQPYEDSITFSVELRSADAFVFVAGS